MTPLMVEKSPFVHARRAAPASECSSDCHNSGLQDWLACVETLSSAVDTAVLNLFRVGETETCPQLLAPARFEVPGL